MGRSSAASGYRSFAVPLVFRLPLVELLFVPSGFPRLPMSLLDRAVGLLLSLEWMLLCTFNLSLERISVLLAVLLELKLWSFSALKPPLD